MLHRNSVLGDRHAPHNWEYANSTAREAASGFVTADIGKIALQLSDFSFWTLSSVDPTWEPVAGASSTAVTALFNCGFPVDSSGGYLCTLTYNENTRTVTLTPTATQFDVWAANVKYTKVGAQSIVHGSTQGGHFVYFDDTGTLVTGTTPWDLLKHAPVCFIHWDATNSRGIPFEERHHAGRDVYWHRNQHTNEGTKASSGFGISGYTLSDGSVDSALTWAMATGRAEDEDIRVDTQSLADGGPYTILERSGASGDWIVNRTWSLPFLYSGNNIQYNQNNGGTWQRTNVAEDQFVNYWIFGLTALPTTDITPAPTATQQIIIVPGQQTYASQALAEAASFASALSLGTFPFQECVLLYRVTMRYNASAPSAYTNTTRTAIMSVARQLGSFASITQSAASAHGSLAGLGNDDHTQYAMANPLAAEVTYNASGTTTVPLDGGRTETFYATAATGGTTWAITGAVASGKTSSFTLELTNGGSQTQTWPASVKWDGGTAPTLTAAGVDILTFYTRDGGTTWRGFLVAADSK